jgi:hypothetical protein
MRPAACFSMLIAENAVSSPPILINCDTPSSSSDDTTCSSSSGLFVGFAQRVLAIHAAVANTFTTCRHLVTAKTHRRDEAFAA